MIDIDVIILCSGDEGQWGPALERMNRTWRYFIHGRKELATACIPGMLGQSGYDGRALVELPS